MNMRSLIIQVTFLRRKEVRTSSQSMSVLHETFNILRGTPIPPHPFFFHSSLFSFTYICERNVEERYLNH